MKIVGLCSSYREGRLTLGALESLEALGPDNILVYEGPAGEPLEADVPESIFPDKSTVLRGRWRTDARKRDAMLREAKRRAPGVTWGVWLDGDEILVNGEYLRDILQAVVWQDERDGEPTIRFPVRKIESDGSMSTTTGRVFRVDLVRSIDISVSVVTNEHGIEEAWGDERPDSEIWIKHFLGAMDSGRMVAWPPMPCEPVIFHRSHLRHPARRGLRLHEQEAVELRKAGKL